MTDEGLAGVTHGMAETEPGLRLHYATAGEGPATVVLLHGFPQTWWEWRHLIPVLAAAGYRVVAPDYRGAGHSWRPAAGYDKRTMAADVHRLLTGHLGVRGPVALVGHDIGLMVAYAYAQAYRDEVTHLAVVDAPLPGTTVFDRLRGDPRVWHFAFHAARDVAELLVAGRERPYLQAFFDARVADPSAIGAADLDTYVTAYSAPGAMRAGFEVYRTFDQDAEDNRAALTANGKLTVPVLAVGGAISTTGPLIEEMMREVAENVTGLRVPGTGHWIPEENPAALADGLTAFLAAR
ncbi:alpha/beta fold hydrolase [Streptomyces litchfieldiae]|uniref:Alpha/beta hydrolase n=1 Tax=Streptomyces litchfieldiae TaxID=3075543 RepID=A0ABU2MK75_9ACTN|nr:alpha/beta hydrolase [Streptomyces sp. DSM 44938]MDT0341847.1 alpha/beta hydrolase [Streptomyces sp. DSM 44938]